MREADVLWGVDATSEFDYEMAKARGGVRVGDVPHYTAGFGAGSAFHYKALSYVHACVLHHQCEAFAYGVCCY